MPDDHRAEFFAKQARKNSRWEVAATGLEHIPESPEIPSVSIERGTESGTLADKIIPDSTDEGTPPASADAAFGDALRMIAALPLSDAEKAEAVRRLLDAAKRPSARD